MVASKVSQFKNKDGKTIVITFADVGLENPTLKERARISDGIRREREQAAKGDIISKEIVNTYEAGSLNRQKDRAVTKEQAEKLKDKYAKLAGLPRENVDKFLDRYNRSVMQALRDYAANKVEEKAAKVRREYDAIDRKRGSRSEIEQRSQNLIDKERRLYRNVKALRAGSERKPRDGRRKKS